MEKLESVYRDKNICMGYSLIRRYSLAKQCIEPYLNKQTIVADLGCGDGYFLETISDRIKMGIGVDIGWEKADSLWVSRSKNLTFLKGDIIATKIEERVDIAVCMEVLEHVQNPEKVVAHLKTIIKPNGIVLITVPIETGPSLLAKNFMGFLTGYRGRIRYWSLKETLLAAFNPLKLEQIREISNIKAHKGFNFKKIIQLCKTEFKNVVVKFSPFPKLGSYANVSVIILCFGA